MNERPWQSNLWRSIHETPHVAPHTSVAAYLMFKDGHVIRGTLFQGSHKECTGTFAGTNDLQVLPGVVKWQPVLGQAAVMAPTPESKVNVDPPKEDELPIEEQIFNDLVNEDTRWQPPHRLDPNDPDAVWILTTHGNVEKAYPFRDEKDRLYWGPDEGCRLRAVAWATIYDHINYCPEILHAKPERPKRKTGQWPNEEQVISERERALAQTPPDEGYSELKGQGAEKPDRLQRLADFLHDIVPGLSAAFSKKDDEKPVRLCAHPLTIPAFSCEDYVKRPAAEDVNRHLHEELRETGKAIEDNKGENPPAVILPKGTIPPPAKPEPVETKSPTNGDWTDGRYKTAKDYDVPSIPGYDELSREHHEGVVRMVLRDLIQEKTRDQTLDEYLDAFTPMEFSILQGLATGQEHFVDTKGLAAFNYDRLYRSGFITRIAVTFGPRLDRNTRQGMGGGGSATGNVPMGAYGGGGSGHELWELTPLGQQFMAYLLARDNRRHVAKNSPTQSK